MMRTVVVGGLVMRLAEAELRTIPYFAAMLDSGMRESDADADIVLPDRDPLLFLQVLRVARGQVTDLSQDVFDECVNLYGMVLERLPKPPPLSWTFFFRYEKARGEDHDKVHLQAKAIRTRIYELIFHFHRIDSLPSFIKVLDYLLPMATGSFITNAEPMMVRFVLPQPLVGVSDITIPCAKSSACSVDVFALTE